MYIMFYIVGSILSVLGFISGIVTGVVTRSFLLCLLVWLSTFLYVIIYFGLGDIISNQDIIMQKLNSKSKDQSSKSLSSGEWKCPKCGRVNANYVGACGCGTIKSSVVHKWRCSNCGAMISSEICPNCGHSH